MNDIENITSWLEARTIYRFIVAWILSKRISSNYVYIEWKEEPGSLQRWKTSKCHTGNLSL